MGVILHPGFESLFLRQQQRIQGLKTSVFNPFSLLSTKIYRINITLPEFKLARIDMATKKFIKSIARRPEQRENL